MKDKRKDMASARKKAVEGPQTRALLMDTAELIMKEEGYPAVTTRRIASRMGVSNQLVHYYFRTMDDLLLSVMRRGAERSTRRLMEALTSEDPLRALWEFHKNPDAVRLYIEFMALANHRKGVFSEAARNTEQMRALESEAISRVLAEQGISPETFPAAGLSVVVSAIPQIMMIEAALGVSLGHTEAAALADRFMRMLSGNDRTARKSRTAGRGKVVSARIKRR
jgi:AcrR family transcriptional regulator